MSGQSTPRVRVGTISKAKVEIAKAKVDNKPKVENKKAAEEKDDNDNSAQSSSISFLNADSVRWMNKRQPASRAGAGCRVLPSKALQLKSIFEGLDYSERGNIDIEDLQEAIFYVSSQAKRENQEPVFENPAKLVQFFKSMDINGDGTVDFNKFLIAMTSQTKDDVTFDHQRLTALFFEFANEHRRRQILDLVETSSVAGFSLTTTTASGGASVTASASATSDTTSKTPFVQQRKVFESDFEKYLELKKLFDIKYFRDDPVDVTVQDKLKRVQEEAIMQKKLLQSDEYRRQRRREQMRAREASIFFDQLRRRQHLQRHRKLVESTSTHHAMGGSSNAFLTNTTLAALNTVSNSIPTVSVSKRHTSGKYGSVMAFIDEQSAAIDSEFIQMEVEKKIRQNFAAFPLHDAHTFTPLESAERLRSVEIRKAARNEADTAKYEKFMIKNVPMILPPITIKDRLQHNIDTARESKSTASGYS
jgi:hypothetical protein